MQHKTDFLLRVGDRWRAARTHYRDQLIKELSAMFDQFHDLGLADPHFSQRLATGGDSEHQQRLAEMLLAKHLLDHGFTLASTHTGPDFKATKDDISVWIELVTPEPRGIAPNWLSIGDDNGVSSYPHTEIALRYTSALKEKHEKLTGSARNQGGYLGKGIVGSSDPYVIAINQHLLQNCFRTLNGISQIPTACEVLYSVGAQQFHMDRATGRIVDADHSHRPSLHKEGLDGKVAFIPADNFLNATYRPVSAVMALDLQEEALITTDPGTPKKEHLAAVIHNLHALNPVPPRFLPAQEHWVAKMSENALELLKVHGIPA